MVKFKNDEAFLRLRNFAFVAMAVFGFGGAATWAVCAFQTHRTVVRAEGYLQKGFAALAFEAVEPYRNALIQHPKGCQLMITTYYQAKQAQRLEWAAQACLEAGKETPEAYLGLAGARELAGRDADALQILSQVAGKFDKIPDIYYTMAQILKRNKKEQDALFAYSKAIERAPDNKQLALETLEYSTSLQKWDIAKQLADRLKGVETDNPEVKLFIARALIKGGDSASAQPLAAQAKTLLASKPAEFRSALEKAYADVFAGAGERIAAERNLASEHGK